MLYGSPKCPSPRAEIAPKFSHHRLHKFRMHGISRKAGTGCNEGGRQREEFSFVDSGNAAATEMGIPIDKNADARADVDPGMISDIHGTHHEVQDNSDHQHVPSAADSAVKGVESEEGCSGPAGGAGGERRDWYEGDVRELVRGLKGATDSTARKRVGHRKQSPVVELRKSVKDHVEVDQAAGGEGQGAGRRAGPSRAAPPPLDGMSIPSGGSLFANMFAPPPEEEVPAVEEAPASSRRLFRDVHGVDEAKGELQELVEYLKNPEKFKRLGAQLPTGLLMVGPPGTGKTLLARAVAGEAGVPFFYQSGASFEEKYVGVGAARIRNLFETARRRAPCVVFVDELDAVGARRDDNTASSAPSSALAQLLTELDGFQSSGDVVLLAATNLPDMLDPALTRPGRLDRQLAVSLPDLQGRRAILQYHLEAKPAVSPEADALALARSTPGFSGADLANLINVAAWEAAKDDALEIGLKHLDAGKDRMVMGVARTSSVMSDKARRAVAYHEAGHALVALVSEHAKDVRKATIIPHGLAMGMVVQMPDKDEAPQTFAQMKATLDVYMGGRASELCIFGEEGVTAGAQQDIQQASALARAMVQEWGLSAKVGPVYHGALGAKCTDLALSESERALIDGEVRDLLNNAMQRAVGIVTKNKAGLARIAEALIEHESLTADAMRDLLLDPCVADMQSTA